jgi:ion channel-forming bestrophin family protein
MYTKRNYDFWMTFNWSRQPFFIAAIYALPITALAHFGHWDISLPWQPISVLGISVAFYLGFKNNSSYDRTWEARKIWGGIVNSSRTFGAAVTSFIQGEDKAEVQNIRRRLIYRHIAWLTAMRYQLRLSRDWEHKEDRVKGLYSPNICEEYFNNMDQEVMNLIEEEEFERYKTKTNIATQIIATQARELQHLHDLGYFDSFRHIEFHRLITTFYDDQGRSERIKNFPFPRQYASVALWNTMVFAALLPWGLLNVFAGMENSWRIWLTIPFNALITWVFFLMEKIGDYSENPFEGTYNDVPITSISRAIEIDLREMLGETEVPKPIAAVDGFLM